MHRRLRRFWLVPLIAVAAASLWQATVEQASARDHLVIIREPDQEGRWRFDPPFERVKRGDNVVFRSPAGSEAPHTVTDLDRTSSPTTLPVKFEAGNLFDSGFIQPGDTYTLDTSDLEPGHYPYICRLHPWMVAEVTVVQ